MSFRSLVSNFSKQKKAGEFAGQVDTYLLSQLRDIKQNDLGYSYRGSFTPNIISSIMDLSVSNLDKSEDKSKIKKKVYYVIGEGIQNISLYEKKDLQLDKNASIVTIDDSGNIFSIITGNLILNSKVDDLKERIEKINTLDKDGLREYSRSVKRSGQKTEKGGAGLGLIEMARRSGNKLGYHFDRIDKKNSYYYLRTFITGFSAISSSKLDKFIDFEQYVKEVQEFRHFLNQENILLFFKGDFDQRNLINLLQIIEQQIGNSKVSVKLYNLTVEMIQNIVKHASNLESSLDWKPGLFYISLLDDSLVLTSCNFLPAKQQQSIQEKIDFLNNLNQEDLTTYRNNILGGKALEDPVKVGLGFTDLLRRSSRKLQYSFMPVNENYVFYKLNVSLKVY